MPVMTILLSVIALLIGAIVGWVSASVRKTGAIQRALAERDLARAERERSEAVAAEARRVANAESQARVAAETQSTFLGDARKQMEESFAATAQKTLATISSSFLELNKAHLDGSKGEIVASLDTKKAEIDTMLQPLRDMLDRYAGELTKSEHSRNEAYGGLQEQIRSLLAAQELSQREASRLANALDSPAVRGSWGENSLKRCIEMAGMSELCDFDAQQTFLTDEGRRLRPDVVIHLPNKRVIAVDAKVPLTDYSVAANETDESRKRDALTAHARTLRRHIDSLSRKEYQASVGESLDFTVMFLPGEHFLSAALVTDPMLFEYAVEKKIYLASPTVLLPLLRAVAAGWKAERTEENAKKMHDAGVELFNRFVKVMDLIADIGGALAKTVDHYNKAIRSIDTRLWPKGQEMQRMAGSGKELEALSQVDTVPLESSRLRLTMQGEEPAEVLPFRE
jgi:DNA recombination protein RmuC